MPYYIESISKRNDANDQIMWKYDKIMLVLIKKQILIENINQSISLKKNCINEV